MAKISISIHDYAYERLLDFSKKTSSSIEEIIEACTTSISYTGLSTLENLMEAFRKVSKKRRLLVAFSEIFEGYSHFHRCLVKPILRQLKCEGHYLLEDMDFYFDRREFWLFFAQARWSRLKVHGFIFDWSDGTAYLEAYHYLPEDQEEFKEALRKAIEKILCRNSCLTIITKYTPTIRN